MFDQAEPEVTAYSYEGISQEPFPDNVKKILLEPVDPKDVEIKTGQLPSFPFFSPLALITFCLLSRPQMGSCTFPRSNTVASCLMPLALEVLCSRLATLPLSTAESLLTPLFLSLLSFFPSSETGWALMPKSKHSMDNGILSREYALYCLGRFVSQARGEQQYFEKVGLATAQEAVKSNALVRCCKDLGIAHSLWDPDYITKWKAEHAVHVFAETKSGAKTKVWRRKDRKLEYPYVESTTTTAAKK